MKMERNLQDIYDDKALLSYELTFASLWRIRALSPNYWPCVIGRNRSRFPLLDKGMKECLSEQKVKAVWQPTVHTA
jgi:hypothetical protein